MKIDQICKENIQTYNLDYILIDDFAIDFATEQNLRDCLRKKQTSGMNFHIVNDTIDNYNTEIIQAVNNAFDVDVKSLEHGIQHLNKTQSIPPHDDATGSLRMPKAGSPDIELPYTQMPVRAILYINPEYMYGTHLHKEDPCFNQNGEDRWWSEHWDSGNEIGGKPGQLLLIKPNENAWHSVGLHNNTLDNRITSNWIFFL